ncbi:MAG: PorV/PorQ family protein [Ignavibacteria bacterium]|jgi:hypothetical protein
MNNVLRSCLLSIIVIAIASPDVRSQQASMFPFLRSLISSRSAALGGSTVASVGDAANVVLNPAVAATTEASELSGTFVKHVADINAGLATYTTDVANGSGAITLGYTNYGAFNRSTVDGNVIGSFGASDVSLGLSFAKELDTLIAYGATLKVLHSNLADMRSTAIAMDAGLLFRFPAKRTNIGLSILNLGTQLSTYDGTSDRLPLDVRVGLNHRLRGLPLMINLSFNHLADDVDDLGQRFSNFSLGGEFYVGKYVQVRVAYDNAMRNTSAVSVSTQLSGFSAGLGVRTSAIHFDYALNVLGASSVLHRVTVSSSL